MSMNPFKKENKNILPAPFQRGTEENKLAEEFFQAGSIAAGIFLGLTQVFKGLCQANENYRQQKRR